MMEKIRLILMTICVFIMITGCNSSNGAAPSEETTSVEADSGNALADSIQTILDDKEYYPDITSIEVTSDYTLFTITLESDVIHFPRFQIHNQVHISCILQLYLLNWLHLLYTEYQS